MTTERVPSHLTLSRPPNSLETVCRKRASPHTPFPAAGASRVFLVFGVQLFISLVSHLTCCPDSNERKGTLPNHIVCIIKTRLAPPPSSRFFARNLDGHTNSSLSLLRLNPEPPINHIPPNVSFSLLPSLVFFISLRIPRTSSFSFRFLVLDQVPPKSSVHAFKRCMVRLEGRHLSPFPPS